MRRSARLLLVAAVASVMIVPAVGHAIAGQCTVTSDTTSLWPPNHKLHTVTLTGSQGCVGGIKIDMVTQDEATNAKGSGHTVLFDATNCNHTQGSDTATVDLRAERSGLRNLGVADGRLYDVHWSEQLGTDHGDIYVSVPHDMGHPGPVTGTASMPSGDDCASS